MDPTETILVDIPLTPEIISLLENQNAIQSEMLLNVTEIKYLDYLKFLDENRDKKDVQFITEII